MINRVSGAWVERGGVPRSEQRAIDLTYVRNVEQRNGRIDRKLQPSGAATSSTSNARRTSSCKPWCERRNFSELNSALLVR
jgi:hypothetical protein